MSLQTTRGSWLIEDQWRAFECTHDQMVRHLESLEPDADLPRFIPAPVDLHVHGGGGADVMQGRDAIVQVLQAHARRGTGAMLATSVTAPLADIDRFLLDVAAVMRDPPADGARLLGAHLEGPFINPGKLGAQPPYAVAVDEQRLEAWFASGVVRVITYAPEQDPGDVVPTLCARHGVKAQLGHTLCKWSQAQRAILAGAGVTHMFNAMSGVAHRDGGAATAALAYADFAEIITDGIHVDRAAFDLAHRSIPHLYSVTDATAAAGMPDGQYRLGSLCIHKRGSSVYLDDGTLAGSCLTQCESLAQLRAWDLDWLQISRLCSEFPCLWIGEARLGVIAEGALCNWLEIQNDSVAALWLNGARYPLQEKDNA